MSTVEVFFWIEDYEKIDSIPNLKKIWEYSDEDCLNLKPDEWGKLEFDEITVKFFGKNG